VVGEKSSPCVGVVRPKQKCLRESRKIELRMSVNEPVGSGGQAPAARLPGCMDQMASDSHPDEGWSKNPDNEKRKNFDHCIGSPFSELVNLYRLRLRKVERTS